VIEAIDGPCGVFRRNIAFMKERLLATQSGP